MSVTTEGWNASESTHVVQSATLAPNLHIRSLCLIAFAVTYPSLDLTGKRIMSYLSLSIEDSL